MTSPTDPDVSDDDALTALRAQLTLRINSSPHPSRLINRLAVADLRCAESASGLTRLISRAPRVLRVIRAELRKAFDLDPDSVIFTEPRPPAAAQKVDSLTDRALRLMVLASVSINLNQYTALSFKDDPARRLPFTPLEALRRVIALNLFDRLAQAHTRYWQALVPGSWLTRQARWEELHARLFANQAFVARQVGELSSAGHAMAQALVDAPTAGQRQRAGERWASVQACALMWPGVGPRLMPIPGALHIYREGEPVGMPHVMYLPGGNRNFYEYPSFDQLQCGLVTLINGALFDDLWQCLPLRRRHEACEPGAYVAAGRGLPMSGDALAFSAHTVLEAQWDNELACAVSINLAQVFSRKRQPGVINAARFLAYIERARKHWLGKPRLRQLRRELQDWDQRRRRKEIIFASTAEGLAMNTALHQLKRYEKGLMTLLDPRDPGEDTPAVREFVALEDQCKAHGDTLLTLLQAEPLRLFEAAFWRERPSGQLKRATLFIHALSDLLRCEVQMQHRLKLIRTVDRDLLLEVLDTPLASKREGADTCVLSVLVGSESHAFHALHSVFAVTRTAAVSDPERRVPVVLCGFGQQGGVAAFSSLGALSRGVQASLGSRDGSLLWRYVERQKRQAVREQIAAQTLAVRYESIEGNPVLLALKRLLKGYVLLQGSDRVSNETHDTQLSRQLLAAELHEQLSAPVSDALIQARAHFDLVRKAAEAKKNLPQWLTDATAAQLNRFKHLQGHYLGNVFAFEERLKQRLPELHTFARERLIARLREDGLYPQVDIDTPFIELPDQVDGQFCGWESACTVGDRKELLTPSPTRKPLSLLQLALHNLDPQMLPTHWRFKYARYLQPAWKPLLGSRYLIDMVSSLDIGGQYEGLINREFYPPDAREPGVAPLLRRALRSAADADLYSAIRQGLTAHAQSLFKTAMAAHSPQDLQKNGHHVHLYAVHLAGHTLLHDRYIAGILVMHDRISQRCVVYWPTAPDARSLSEHPTLQQVREHLNSIGALPGNVAALARHVAPGWAFEAINHRPGETPQGTELLNPLNFLPGFTLLLGVWHGVEFVRSFKVKHWVPTALVEEIEKQILEQVASDSLNWLALVPTSHCDAEALLYQARVLDLHRHAQANSNSGKTLQKYREQRLAEQSDTRRRALLSMVVPFFGLGNQLYELLLTSRRYHHSGDAREAVTVAFGVVFLAVDLLLMFIPGPKLKTGTLARPGLRSMGAGLHRLQRSSLLESGQIADRLRPSSTVTLLKPLERFRVQGTPSDAIALKGVGERGLYVKSGEFFVAGDTHHYPVYRRADETFFRLKNKDAPGQDEWILTLHESREWLLGADAPMAGPSSGVLTPWRAPLEQVDWRPPAVRSVTQDRIRRSTVPTQHWFDWRVQGLGDSAAGTPVSGVFHVHLEPPGFPYDVIYLGARSDVATSSAGGYYRLLHQGEQAPLSDIAFIARNEPLVSRANVDIERWTSSALSEQPIPVTRSPAGEWQLHAPLFDGPLEPLVGVAFPTMTSSSRKFAVIRLIELADVSRSVTASHLLNVRATLDHWLTPNPVKLGQTDDWLLMLRPIPRRGAHINIGFEGKAPGFTRVDFIPSAALDARLRTGGRQVAEQRSIAQRAAIRTVLEQQGFIIHEWNQRRGKILSREWVVTHSRSDKVYYLREHWLERGSVRLANQLTDPWINAGIRSYHTTTLAATVKAALAQQRLVRIVAGVQWPKVGNLPPTVYFVKVSPLSR